MKVPFVNFSKQDSKYENEITEAIWRCRSYGKYILQQDVEEFEERLAAFVGTQYAVGVNSCTDALLLSLRYLGIGHGDEVITVGHTFHATVEAIVHNGAKPVLVDVGPDSMMDMSAVERAITPRAKAVIPVHLMGDMADVARLKQIAERHGLYVVEDAAQALGAHIGGKMAGSWGRAGCFSFYPAKILGSYGDGGAITTNDEAAAKELKDMRQHYKYNPGKYGFNSRLDNIQAAILNVKMKHIGEILGARKHVADIYNHELRQEPILLPVIRYGRVWQDFIIRTDKRDDLKEYLAQRDVETLKNDYHFPDDLPKPKDTILLESQTLRLPCNDVLEDEEVLWVCQKIKEFYG